MMEKNNSKILKSNCPLCFLEKRTIWLEKFFGSFWRIIICGTCKIPMAVYKWHSISPSEEDKRQMIESLKMAAEEFYGNNDFYIDEGQRKIKDHWHIHARKGKRK